MARLDEKKQAARREHILNAAEQCFARQGFHRTSMHDICREAGVSAGALYLYFSSKEELIGGLCEREQRQLGERLSGVAAASDFMQALATLGETYCVQQPRDKVRLQIEINAEALRNPAICSTVRAIDSFVLESFERLLRQARDEGRISPAADPAAIARVLAIIGDGMTWQRAFDEDFDPGAVMPVILSLVSSLINPGEDPAGAPAPQTGT